MRVDWPTHLRRRPTAAPSPSLAHLATPSGDSGRLSTLDSRPGGRAAGLRSQLLRLPRPAARQLLAAYLREVLAEVSRLGADGPVAGSEDLFDLGLDSLMAVDMRARFEADLELSLPATLVIDRRTLAGVEGELAARLFPAPAAPSPPAAVAPPASGDEAPPDEAEAEALLLEELRRLDF